MGKASHWAKGSALAGTPADARADDPIRSPIRVNLTPAFEANVIACMDLIQDLGLPDDVTRRSCPDGLEHFSLVVIQTAAARVRIEHELRPKPAAPATRGVLLTAEDASSRVESLGLTRRAFAFECDMLPTLLSAYLNGRRPMPDYIQSDILATLLRLEGTLR